MCAVARALAQLRQHRGGREVAQANVGAVALKLLLPSESRFENFYSVQQRLAVLLFLQKGEVVSGGDANSIQFK